MGLAPWSLPLFVCYDFTPKEKGVKLNALAVSRLSTAYQKQAQTTHAPNGRQKCLIEIVSPLFGVRNDKTTLHDMQDLHLSKYTQTHYTGYSAPKHICVSVCPILSGTKLSRFRNENESKKLIKKCL
jgi:hypothetical protein